MSITIISGTPEEMMEQLKKEIEQSRKNNKEDFKDQVDENCDKINDLLNDNNIHIGLRVAITGCLFTHYLPQSLKNTGRSKKESKKLLIEAIENLKKDTLRELDDVYGGNQ